MTTETETATVTPRRRRKPAPDVLDAGAVAQIVPAMVDVQLIGARLEPPRSTHSLVAAASRGQFPRVTRIGAKWYARVDEVKAWFDGNHATLVSPGLVGVVRRAGRGRHRGGRAPLPSDDLPREGRSASS